MSYGNNIFTGESKNMYDSTTTSKFENSWNSGAYNNTVGDTVKKGAIGGATGWLGALMTGSNAISPGAGFLLSGLVSVGGSLLNSLFGRRPKVTLSPEQQYFKDLTNFYSDLGAKTRTARAVASVYGVSPEKVAKIGYNNFDEMIDKHGFNPTAMKKTAPDTTTLYDEKNKGGM
jgi:hypothetical protein